MKGLSRKMIGAVVAIVITGGLMANAEDEGSKTTLTGIYLKAILIAHSDFIRIVDMTSEEKDLSHYDIECSADSNNYIVEFIPKLLTEQDAKRLNRMVLGRNTKYWIDKQNNKINKRVFYKA